MTANHELRPMGLAEKLNAAATRDAEETRRELRSYSPDELDRLVAGIEEEMSDLEERIATARQEMQTEIRTVVKKHTDANKEEVQSAVHKARRGLVEEHLEAGLKRLTEAAEEATDERQALAFRGRERHTFRLVRELADMLNRRDELEHRLNVAQQLLSDWRAGRVELGVQVQDDGGTDLPASTEDYLRAAYEWIEADNRPSGQRPTELWTHIREETGKSKKTIRQTFRRRGWHSPDPPLDMTQSEYVVEAVQEAVEEHFE